MSSDLTRWLLAAIAAGTIALLARRRRSLSANGMLTATIMGTVLVGTSGWWSGLLLVAFFLSSSILSHRGPSSSISQARGAERDAVQVLANGGVALASAVLYAITGRASWLVLLGGSIAGANADTWSTEIGRTSRTLPRLVTTWRQVAAGTSGAVSARGLAGALAGGALIGTLAGLGWAWDLIPGNVPAIAAFTGITVGGLAGSLVDSLLGATVQDKRWCDSCRKETEQAIHRCGTPTRSIRGIAWIDNDIVNVTCSMTGGLVAWLLVSMLT